VIQLVTAPLEDKIILDGVTRRSILQLARERLTIEVVERAYTMDEIVDAIKEKRMIEAFAAGTAVSLLPVPSYLSAN
jgi:branched-chain amino acid aminotransferase